MSQATIEMIDAPSESNLIPNSDFSRGTIGGLPEGWTIGTRNAALGPIFELVEDRDGRRALQARGNGRDDCFGWVHCVTVLPAKSHFRLRVHFRMDGIDDVNRHLIHGIFSVEGDGGYFNQGILSYERQDDGVVGELVFPGPEKEMPVQIRLYLRYTAHGSVRWDRVSLEQCEPPPPRLVKIAVVKGQHGLEHWAKVFDEAGRANCDVALLPELFDENYEPSKAVSMEGPEVRLLADHAARHRMYVSGALYVKRGDITYNCAPLFDRRGELLGIHDKVILYDPETDNGASCGRELKVFQTDFGRVGIMTCYESWYPAVAQLLALKGAELILFPSAGYYEELIHARAADNGVVIAASSLGCSGDVWDSGGNRAGGEANPDRSRNAPTSVVRVEKIPQYQLTFVTVDLNKTPSPHSWGGPMKSAPGGRRVRNTSLFRLEDEISREVRRW